VRFENADDDTALHRFYNDLKKAYRATGRYMDLPSRYAAELECYGFVNVTERAYLIPLCTKGPVELLNSIITSWSDGFEAYSLELMSKQLGKRCLEILVSCASARKALRDGVDGFLEM
jgi:hypothetical protein